MESDQSKKSEAVEEVLARTRHAGLQVLNDPALFAVLLEAHGLSCTELGEHLGPPGEPFFQTTIEGWRRKIERRHGIRLPRAERGHPTGTAVKKRREELATLVRGNGEEVGSVTHNAPSVESLLKQNAQLQRDVDQYARQAAAMVESVRVAFGSLPPLKVPVIPKAKKGREQIATLAMSDLHIGALAKPITTAGLADYDFSIFKKRLWRLRDGVFSIIDKERSAFPIRTLHIDWLGDGLEGEVLFPGQAHQISLPELMQVAEGGREIAAFIRECAGFFEEVRVHAVPGNHPEGTRRQQEQHPVSRSETVFLLFLEQMLAEQANVRFFISPSRFLIYKLWEGDNTQYRLLMHGQECRSYFTVPYYSMDRLSYRMVQLSQVPLHVIELGHHHVGADIETGYIERIHNGSMVGPSQYSVDDLQTASYASQTLFGSHPDEFVTWRYRVRLSDRPKLKEDPDGILTPWISIKEGRGFQWTDQAKGAAA